MDGNFTTTAIITKGLNCQKVNPCQTGIITTFFSLYCKDVGTPQPLEPKPRQTGTGGGGPYPRPAWNRLEPGQAKNFYKPVVEQAPYLVSRDQEAALFSKNKVIILRMKFGQSEIERNYVINTNRAKYIVKVLSVLDQKTKQFSVTITKIKNTLKNASVKIPFIKRKE